MARVLGAGQDILGALAVGEHVTVGERAQQIHDSCILQRSLSEQDREDLMAAVPPEFVELDRTFHETWAEFAPRDVGRARARAGDVEQELRASGQTTEACVTCRGRFATNLLPGLAKD